MPRSCKRLSFRMRLRWANNISTFLRSWRERTYCAVAAMRRATSRAASWPLRASLRNAVFGQHLDLVGQATQRGLLVSDPVAQLRPSIHQAIRLNSQSMGDNHWPTKLHAWLGRCCTTALITNWIGQRPDPFIREKPHTPRLRSNSSNGKPVEPASAKPLMSRCVKHVKAIGSRRANSPSWPCIKTMP